jgi:hypothetical protein
MEHVIASFITVLTKTRHRTLSWASRIQFSPLITLSLRSILMLSSHLRLGLPFASSNQNPVNTFLIPQACHMFRPPHPPWFDHSNNIRWRIQAVKFIIMLFSSWSVLLPFRSKYPQHSVLKDPKSLFLPHSERPSFAPVQYNWQNYSSAYFNLQFFLYETGRQYARKCAGVYDNWNVKNKIQNSSNCYRQYLLCTNLT